MNQSAATDDATSKFNENHNRKSLTLTDFQSESESKTTIELSKTGANDDPELDPCLHTGEPSTR